MTLVQPVFASVGEQRQICPGGGSCTLSQDLKSVVLHTLGWNSFKVFLTDCHEPLQSLEKKEKKKDHS